MAQLLQVVQHFTPHKVLRKYDYYKGGQIAPVTKAAPITSAAGISTGLVGVLIFTFAPVLAYFAAFFCIASLFLIVYAIYAFSISLSQKGEEPIWSQSFLVENRGSLWNRNLYCGLWHYHSTPHRISGSHSSYQGS